MTELDKGQKADRRAHKYLWFGYGSYSGQPNLQIPGGNLRDPGLFEWLSKEPKAEGSPTTYCLSVAALLIGLMAFVMLLAWGIMSLL